MNLFENTNSKSTWKILATDYDNYAIKYNCSNGYQNLYHSEYITVLGRQTTLSDEVMDKVRAIVKE